MTMTNSKPKRPLSIHGPTVPERQWTKILADWSRTNLEGAAFCRKRGLSYAAFRFWKKEIPDRERRRKKMNDHRLKAMVSLHGLKPDGVGAAGRLRPTPL
jgi:hypothetical protein